jgi:hypothetical protein
MSTKRSFPGADEAIGLEVEELAMCVLDLLVAGPAEVRNEVTSRAQLVSRIVGDEYTRARRKLEPRGMFSFSSDQAITAFPHYARALTEAWSYLESQGLVVPDPQRPDHIFVGALGVQRHSRYRGESTSEVPRAARAAQQQAPSRTSSNSPSAVVVWAHGDSEWDSTQKKAWEETVVSFTHLLRGSGIDADLDLFHGHLATDWARFGPAAIRNSDFVLVAVSNTWRRAWDGDLDDDANAGAKGEANTLLGLFQKDSKAFLEKVIPVVLPGANDQDIPSELRATTHWSRVPTLDEDGIEDVYRRITGQAGHPKPPLGPLRKLGPVVSNPSVQDLSARIVRTEDAIADLPDASSDVTAPKDQARHALEERREHLLRELAELGGATPTAAPPRLVPYPRWSTGTFNLHMPAGPLNVHLLNEGGSTARISSATLATVFGVFEGLMYAEEPPPLQPEPAATADLPPDTHLFLAFGEGQLADLPTATEPLHLRVRYTIANQPGTYEFRLDLHRAGSDPGFRPQWRAKRQETLAVE